MALTFTKTADGVMGDHRFWAGVVAFDADTFPTGGELVTAANFGFQISVEWVLVGVHSALVTTRTVGYDPSTKKLVVIIQDSTPAESAESEVAIVDVPIMAFGY